MISSNSRFTSYFVIGLAGLLGGGTLMLFILFLYVGPLKVVNLGLDVTAALWLNTILCLMFFVQHSVMIRKSFRQWLARFIPEEYDGAFFAIVAGIFLLLLVVFWQQSTYTIAQARVFGSGFFVGSLCYQSLVLLGVGGHWGCSIRSASFRLWTICAAGKGHQYLLPPEVPTDGFAILSTF